MTVTRCYSRWTYSKLHHDCAPDAASPQQQQLALQVNEVHARLTEARTALAPWREQLQAISNERQLVVDQAERLSKEASAATTRRDATAADLEKSSEELKAAQARVTEMEGQQAIHLEEAAQATKLAQEAERNMAVSQRAVAEAKGVHMSLAAALDETRNKGRALRGLLEAQERGQLKAGSPCFGIVLPPCCAAVTNCCVWDVVSYLVCLRSV